MSALDSHHIAPAATNVVNPAPGGVRLEKTSSLTDSVNKDFYEHLEKPTEDRDVVTKADHFGTNTIYTEEETKLVRKLDWHIIPIVFAMYFMNKLDQNAIANARLDTFEKDLGLTGNQFNVCVSVLYAGYTLIQIPSNMLMSTKKVRPSIWMACWMMAWAGVSGATAAVHNYHGALLSARSSDSRKRRFIQAQFTCSLSSTPVVKSPLECLSSTAPTSLPPL